MRLVLGTADALKFDAFFSFVVALMPSCQCRHARRANAIMLLFRYAACRRANVVGVRCHCCRVDVSRPMSLLPRLCLRADVAILLRCCVVVGVIVPMLIVLAVPLPSARLGQGLGTTNHQSD